MSKPIEKVFIVWGGNQPLANIVCDELGKGKAKYSGIVGGGIPTNMFVGTQIISQIEQCSRATILIVINIITAIVYIFHGDWRRVAYWFAAAVIAFSVTW